MNCIIIDDEPLARAELEEMLLEIKGPKVLKQFSNAISALEFIKSNDVDLIFLDIEMPHVKGIDFITDIPRKSLVIFCTAYPQYAVRSYEEGAIDYLLKPFNEKRLLQAVKKAEQLISLVSVSTDNELEKATDEYMIIKADKKFQKINYKDVLYIEGLKDYVIIHTTLKRIIAPMNIKTIQQKIPIPSFVRISKSYVVNTDHITAFDNHTVYLDEKELPLGEIYKNDFLSKFTNDMI